MALILMTVKPAIQVLIDIIILMMVIINAAALMDITMMAIMKNAQILSFAIILGFIINFNFLAV